MNIDNSEIISQFMTEKDDGDTFWYTELMDRSKRTGGNNRRRVLKMFRHGSRAKFLEHWPLMKALCDQNNCRAYTRLSPRSHKTVGKLLTQLTVECAMAEQWHGMAYLYSRACGRSTPVTKTWLFDVDEIDVRSQALENNLRKYENFIAAIPSRKGVHFIARPHWPVLELDGISLHKDNAANLYIPENAE